MELHLLLPVILLSATLLGRVARRVRLPEVVGVIFAGVILGPAVLNVLPSEQADPLGYGLVQGLAHIGLCVLLFQIGLVTPEVSAAVHIVLSIFQAVLLIGLGIFVGPYLVRAVLFFSSWSHERGPLPSATCC